MAHPVTNSASSKHAFHAAGVGGVEHSTTGQNAPVSSVPHKACMSHALEFEGAAHS
jgi:hypothetical protein